MKRYVNYSPPKMWEVLFTGLKIKQAQSLTSWRAGQPFSASLKIKQSWSLTFWRTKDNPFQQAWKQSKPNHSHSEEPRAIIFSRLENKASLVTHTLKNQGQPFSAGLKTKQAQSLTLWTKNNHFQQPQKQSKLSHSHPEDQGQPFSAGFKTKQAQSLTFWRIKDGHFQQALKQSKPSHSHPKEPRTTIFSRLESKASPVTHPLESQGQPFLAGLKINQAQPLTDWWVKNNHF